MRTNRTFTIVLVGLALILGGCSLGQASTPTPGVQADYAPVVSVTGKLAPARWASLGHAQGGAVVQVRVEQGDQVAADQTLLRLDDAALQIALQAAEEQVAGQQAALDRLLAGAGAEVIARADRDHAYQLAQAEISLRVQERNLAQARLQDPARDLETIRIQRAQLDKQLAQARAQDPAAQVSLAQIDLERAKIALDDVQDEYNKALDRPWEDQKIRDGWAKQLEQMQLNYRAAEAGLAAATSARAAHGTGVEALTLQITELENALAKALDAQTAYSMTLATLADQVEAARLDVTHLREWENPYRDPPSAAELAQAESAVRLAQDNARQIAQQIEDLTLRAPFAGVVGAVDARVGQIVVPGQALVTVGDLSTLRVETTDLDEIDIVGISVDQKVDVTFDALPDRVFEGRVMRISPMAEPGSGGVHYTVIVVLPEVDQALRWGMTAFVDIETGQ